MSGGLKEVRSRITSVQSTRQITQAMKMVSAAKLRRAQDAITRMRPYAHKLQEILSNVSSSLDASEGKFSAQREGKKTLIVVITSNRGLCGGFNNNIIKEAIRLKGNEFATDDVSVLSIGKKADDIFKRKAYSISNGFGKDLNGIWDDLTFEHTSGIAKELMDQFESGDWDRIFLVYNAFKNAAVQTITTEQFLPVAPPEKSEDANTTLDYIFEPNKEEIVERIIPNSLKIQLFKALLDSRASEHGARMTAMHKATDNASELIKELKLTYNKARQAAITNEILEIVGGAEALES